MNVASSLCLNGSKYQFEVSELQWAEQFTVLLERSPQPIYLSSSGRQTTSHSYDQNALCPTWSYKVHKYPTSLPGARCFEPGTRAPRSKHVYGRSLESASRRGVKTRAVESVAAPVHSGGAERFRWRVCRPPASRRAAGSGARRRAWEPSMLEPELCCEGQARCTAPHSKASSPSRSRKITCIASSIPSNQQSHPVSRLFRSATPPQRPV